MADLSDQTVDPRFAERLAGELNALGVKLDDDLFFICRSGGRSLTAAKAMAAMGYRACHNVAGGFEGPLDDERHRGHRRRLEGGWAPLAAGLKEDGRSSRNQHRSLKPLHHMSKIRISEEFTTSSTDFIRVATLEELKTAGMIVVRGARCPLLVVHDDGKVFALDNRCPHLGFPLHRGSVEDGMSTDFLQM